MRMRKTEGIKERCQTNCIHKYSDYEIKLSCTKTRLKKMNY